jgi:hypothetical protein
MASFSSVADSFPFSSVVPPTSASDRTAEQPVEVLAELLRKDDATTNPARHQHERMIPGEHHLLRCPPG